MRLPLLGGAYTAQSLIANAQRCVNLYPEQNPGDAPVPVTHYPTPGLTLITAAGGDAGPEIGPGRGLYWASNNKLYCCVGNNIYLIDENWQFTLLGTLVADRLNPVSMIDNGIDLTIVDGSQYRYLVNLETNAFTQDTSSDFLGADHCDYVDTFTVFNQPNTRNFYSTLSNTTTLDPLYVA